MKFKSHYPEYQVMDHKDAWDPHTQEIVSARLVRERPYTFLDDVQAEVVRAVSSTLVEEQRGLMIQYVVCHVDEVLSQNKGESQRKTGVPKEQTLVPLGLKAIQDSSMMRFGKPYFGLDTDKRRQLLEEISAGLAEPISAWADIPQKEWFNKMLTLTLESYYSHPVVWSEIGYGGPAYPRGYIRTNIGQLDPWEAKNIHDTEA